MSKTNNSQLSTTQSLYHSTLLRQNKRNLKEMHSYQSVFIIAFLMRAKRVLCQLSGGWRNSYSFRIAVNNLGFIVLTENAKYCEKRITIQN